MDLIMVHLSNLLDDKLANLVTKQDFLSLHNEIASLKNENLSLKKEICALKNENAKTEKLLDEIDNKSRRNNLIFKGLSDNNQDNFGKIISEFCNEVLKVNLNVDHLQAFPLGRMNVSNRFNRILING
uniref:Uncharacterized protein n=1 Tax=Rhodnius prolixus TaxID=13249 RepID=T1I115_RHOPR